MPHPHNSRRVQHNVPPTDKRLGRSIKQDYIRCDPILHQPPPARLVLVHPSPQLRIQLTTPHMNITRPSRTGTVESTRSQRRRPPTAVVRENHEVYGEVEHLGRKRDLRHDRQVENGTSPIQTILRQAVTQTTRKRPKRRPLFLCIERKIDNKLRHKLAAISEGPFKVKNVDNEAKTVVTEYSYLTVENVLQSRVVLDTKLLRQG